VFGILAAVPPPAAQSALLDTPDTPAATALAFASLFAAWGAGLDCAAARVLRPPPATPSDLPTPVR
jgi:hypothetical protein